MHQIFQRWCRGWLPCEACFRHATRSYGLCQSATSEGGKTIVRHRVYNFSPGRKVRSKYPVLGTGQGGTLWIFRVLVCSGCPFGILRLWLTSDPRLSQRICRGPTPALPSSYSDFLRQLNTEMLSRTASIGSVRCEIRWPSFVNVETLKKGGRVMTS